jgi:hypothetical protein
MPVLEQMNKQLLCLGVSMMALIMSGVTLVQTNLKRESITFYGRYNDSVTLDHDTVKDLIKIRKHSGLTKELLEVMYALKKEPKSIEYEKQQDQHRSARITPLLEELKSKGLVENERGVWFLSRTGHDVLVDP